MNLIALRLIEVGVLLGLAFLGQGMTFVLVPREASQGGVPCD